MQNNLLAQLAEKDSLLEKQQNEINEARAALARLRNELDMAGKEKQVLEKQVEEMKQQEKPHEGSWQTVEHYTEESEKRMECRRKPETSALQSVSCVEYQTALVDGKGRIIQMLPVEHTIQKKERSALTALFSRVCFKKRADIVKMVAEEGLEPKQLVQIRNAIEKDLTEQQLMVLINRQLPAEQMEEIINIAVYENRQRGEG